MSEPVSLTITDVGYRSTHYWVVSAGTSRLLVDLGWPGTMGLLRANLRRMDVPLGEIRCAFATHYHIDHAGLAQELKLAGVPLLVLDVQVDAIPGMVQFTKPRDHYLALDLEGSLVIACSESRALLAEIGVCGEIVHTPGHSDDSVSLVLDGGEVFSGDLTPPQAVWENDAAPVLASWRALRERGARRVYPAHGPVWSLEDLP